jgi:(2Fe-2S) ferredoxin
MTDPESPEAAFEKVGLSGATRHLFLCPGPDCCELADGLATWTWMKRRLAEEGLPVLRTKVQCFRICTGGPWLVIYPEGVWYGGVTSERFERILAEHLKSGVPVAEWVAAVRPLSPPGQGTRPTTGSEL